MAILEFAALLNPAGDSDIWFILFDINCQLRVLRKFIVHIC